MPTFMAAHLEGYEIRFVSAFDPNAVLEGVDISTYLEDPFEHHDKVITHTAAAVPIYCHPPRREEISGALQAAGFKLQDGEVAGGEEFESVGKDAKASAFLARSCIDSIPALDGYADLGDRTHQRTASSGRLLSDEAIALLPPHLQGPILQEVGRYLFRLRADQAGDSDGPNDSSVLELREEDGAVGERLSDLHQVPGSKADLGM